MQKPTQPSLSTSSWGAITPQQAKRSVEQLHRYLAHIGRIDQFMERNRTPMFRLKTSKKRGVRRRYEVWQGNRRIANFHTLQARQSWIQTTKTLALPV